MGLKIADLLRWRTSIILKDSKGESILDDEGLPVEVWIRVVGDEDLQNSYKYGRAASAKKRRELRDTTSEEYLAAIEPIRSASREEVIEVIKTARTQNLQSEAYSNVVRPDELKIEEFAVDPDAPSLEEQEKFDAANEAQDVAYLQALGEYQMTRIQILEAELSVYSDEGLRNLAEEEIGDISALSAFLTEMVDQKVWRSVYMDKLCKIPAFNTIEEYRSSDGSVKQQLIDAYQVLEASPSDIKN
jgi:hypothetical protein